METLKINIFHIVSTLVLFTKVLHGSLIVDTRFDQYAYDSDACQDDFSKCDPMFTFYLARPSQTVQVDESGCYYRISRESNFFDDTEVVEFSQDIRGIPNPWQVEISELKDNTVMLAIRVRDHNFDVPRPMVTFILTHTGPIYASQSVANYSAQALTKDGHNITFGIRMYCKDYYYGDDCATYCNDTGANYTCEEGTGNKLCLDGKICDQIEDPCGDAPCQNGGSCSWVNTTDPHRYECVCPRGWVGDNCETEDTPCAAGPCSNGGECIVTNNSSAGYNCSCPAGYTGATCGTKTPTEDPGASSAPGYLTSYCLEFLYLMPLVMLILH